MEMTATDLRILLVQRGLRQVDVAQRLGVDETLMSRYLNGRREMPEGFTDQFRQAVDELAPVEDSAQVAVA